MYFFFYIILPNQWKRDDDDNNNMHSCSDVTQNILNAQRQVQKRRFFFKLESMEQKNVDQEKKSNLM